MLGMDVSPLSRRIHMMMQRQSDTLQSLEVGVSRNAQHVLAMDATLTFPDLALGLEATWLHGVKRIAATAELTPQLGVAAAVDVNDVAHPALLATWSGILHIPKGPIASYQVNHAASAVLISC